MSSSWTGHVQCMDLARLELQSKPVQKAPLLSVWYHHAPYQYHHKLYQYCAGAYDSCESFRRSVRFVS
eukprot:945317-Rhodomonas_salina.4